MHSLPLARDPDGRRAAREAGRSGHPFIMTQEKADRWHVRVLEAEPRKLIIGRRAACDIALEWDLQVSRVHAELERLGDDWTISDDGMSSNGTFVNGEVLHARRALRDGDAIQVGETSMLFRDPRGVAMASTVPASGPRSPLSLTPAQLRVLAALCRPCLVPGSVGVPATNDEIAAELFLSLSAVKGHLRDMFQRFEIDDLPQRTKRLALVRMAIDRGIVRRGE
jgi:DNA-binding CsgD family transcriptional regulator